MPAEPVETDTRCGFVAIIGAPNAGKSTLVNRLVGTKVSIVSRKVQTTRSIVRGIAMVGRSQIVFVDTPGIFRPRRRLDRAMVETAWGGARDADLVALMIDATRGIDDEVSNLLGKLDGVAHPKLLLLNKVDAVKRESLLMLADQANQAVTFERTFMISAKTGDGLDDLVAYLAQAVPAGPMALSRGRGQRPAAPQPRLRDHAREALRAPAPGAALRRDGGDRALDRAEGRLGQDRADHLRRARQPEEDRDRQGRRDHQGRSQWPPAPRSREIVEHPVHLFLFVKVRENWADDPERYREMGVEFPKD